MTDTLISKLTADGKFLQLEDGFLRFWVDNVGAFSAHDLRAIADHLDRENKPWQDELNEYFDKLEPLTMNDSPECHATAMQRLEKIFDAAIGTPEGDEAETLIRQIAAYEKNVFWNDSPEAVSSGDAQGDYSASIS